MEENRTIGKEREQRTQELIRLIRHDDDVLMERRGWMLISTLVFIHNFPAEEVFEIVATDLEQRFEMSDDLTEIRMRPRHRHAKGVGLELADPPERLYHGIAYILVPYILKTGILGYVALYDDKNEAIEKGRNMDDAPVYVEIDAKKMKEDKVNLYRTREGSWVAFSIAPQYITKVIAQGI